jgi:hypothetical protein
VERIEQYLKTASDFAGVDQWVIVAVLALTLVGRTAFDGVRYLLRRGSSGSTTLFGEQVVSALAGRLTTSSYSQYRQALTNGRVVVGLTKREFPSFRSKMIVFVGGEDVTSHLSKADLKAIWQKYKSVRVEAIRLTREVALRKALASLTA